MELTAVSIVSVVVVLRSTLNKRQSNWIIEMRKNKNQFCLVCYIQCTYIVCVGQILHCAACLLRSNIIPLF